MAYTDLSSTFVYRLLLTHQLMDQLAESDKTFNDLLTAAADFPNNLRFDNNKFLQGEIAAGSTYKKLIGLDTSNIVQLAESGTEVRVPADPTNALGVATKQYVDAVQMLQTQAEVSAASGSSGTLATILSLAATTRGRVHAVYALNNTNVGTVRIQITVDGTVVTNDTGPSIAANEYAKLLPNLKVSDVNTTADDTAGAAGEGHAGHLLEINFNSSLLIEATVSHAATATVLVRYSKIP